MKGDSDIPTLEDEAMDKFKEHVAKIRLVGDKLEEAAKIITEDDRGGEEGACMVGGVDFVWKRRPKPKPVLTVVS